MIRFDSLNNLLAMLENQISAIRRGERNRAHSDPVCAMDLDEKKAKCKTAYEKDLVLLHRKMQREIRKRSLQMCEN